MNNPESIWVREAQKGDEDAFSALVELYQRPVYNLCYRLLGSNPQEAEDAAQETFWRAYRAIRRYDPKRSFATWLLSIAAHYCIDQQRKRRLPETELDDILDETTPSPFAPNPERVVSQSQESEALKALLHTLNPTDRAAVVLRYWHEFSEEEIAQSLNLSVSAVKSRLHRARLKLAQGWRGEQETTAAAERMSNGSPSL